MTFGDYELLEEIARGGMAVVYRARQRSLDRIVAVKRMLFGSLAGSEQVRRFRIEASAAGSLQHPNIVTVHEVGLHDGQHFMAMDYVDGPNLSHLVPDQPPPARKAAAYLKAIAEAVHFAHDRGSGKTLFKRTEHPPVLRLWDATTGREVGTFHGHSFMIARIRFPKDGHGIFSCGFDGQIRLWEAAARERQRPAPRRGSPRTRSTISREKRKAGRPSRRASS